MPSLTVLAAYLGEGTAITVNVFSCTDIYEIYTKNCIQLIADSAMSTLLPAPHCNNPLCATSKTYYLSTVAERQGG